MVRWTSAMVVHLKRETRDNCRETSGPKDAMGGAAFSPALSTAIRVSESGDQPKFVKYNSYTRYRWPPLGNAVGANGTRTSSCRGNGAALIAGFWLPVVGF